MQNFSNQELADIHFVYGFCNGSALAAVNEYRRRYPNRNIPGRRTFTTVHRNLTETGSFRRLHGQGRPLGNYNLEYALNRIEENPQIGIRPLSRDVNIPRSIVIVT